jgi:Heparinase II/III N-terminus/Heparinase II/III-like protein
MRANNLAVRAEESLFIEGYNRLPWSAILTYFQNRQGVKYFSLSKGVAKHVANAESILANEFEFNNEKHKLGEALDWRANPSKDLEWLILLHKFYYLKDLAGAYDYTHDERYAEKWVGLIGSWIAQVPDGFIDSQVTGRRLQQWLLSYHTFVTQWQSPAVTPVFFEGFIYSINSQTHYLCEHLTPEGNHRTLELYAIFLVAVTFPELRSAHWFLEFSKQKLLENMHQDLLPDGVHRELSTDYHHTVLKNYLRFRGLAALNGIMLPAACDKLLKQAIEFSYYIHKPDGFIPTINDGDCNSYLPLLKKAHTYYPDQHVQYVVSKGEEGVPPKQRSRGFAGSGYYVLRSDWSLKPYHEARYLFFDCGPLGFGSHGHYDGLNFELAAYGHSLIVDPGRYTYSEHAPDGVNWRHYFKGTAAHNTVVVDGLDQIPYRCERPVDPEPVASMKHFISAAGFDFLHGQVISHQYPVIHERMIFFMLPEYWIVIDRLTADDSHNYDLYFHLASRAQDRASLVSNTKCHVIHSPNLLIAQACSPDTKVAIEQGYVSPEYGIKQPAPVIKFSKQHTGTTVFNTVLYPFKDEPPVLQVTQVPVYQQGRLCAATEASALQISLSTAAGCFEDYFFINHGASDVEFNFDDLAFTGCLLFLRRDESGQVINVQGEGIDCFKINSRTFLENLKSLGRVSYQEKTLTLSDSSDNKTITLTGLETFPDWSYLSALWGSI